MIKKLDRSRAISDIAAVLGIETSDLTDDMNLLDYGMDSIRLIDLMELWQEYGARAYLREFVSSYRLSEWLRIIGASATPARSDWSTANAR